MEKNIKQGVDTIIYKDDQVVAEGHVTENNMIQMNAPMIETNEFENEQIQKTEQNIGHVNNCTCLICLEAKRRRLNVKRKKGRQYDILEKVSMDMQGPISIKATDGSRYNGKLVDSHSKYITMITTKDKTSSTTKNIFEWYLKRNERQTGRKLKYVATDGGTEFYGKFLDFIESKGIVKIRGANYEHSFPPDAENANGILNRLTRSNLLASHLPPTYWNHAMAYACYCYNRTGSPSPFEKMYDRLPKQLPQHQFGTICYVYKPNEIRKFKFEPVRKRCRFLGYADDDEVEIMDGYVLLDEETRDIIYEKDVVFPKESIPMSKLTDHAEDPTLEDLYIRTDHLEYDDETVADDTTIAPEGNSQSNTSQAVDDTQIEEGLRRSRRLAASVPSPSVPAPESIENTDNSSQYHTANEPIIQDQERNESNSTDDEDSEYDPSTEDTYFSNHKDTQISEEEYAEIWESLFLRYDVVHEIYRTHKQDSSIPKNFKQLMEMKRANHPEYHYYEDAMNKEYQNMEEQKVFLKSEIKHEPPCQTDGSPIRFIDSTWAYAKMYDEDGILLKYKARLCGRGFREIQGIDYEEVYAPTVKHKTVRGITAIAASNDWKLYQDDCKAAYLNAVLEKGKHIKLPDGKFVFIRKCLYGLKESARAWFKMVKQYLLSLNFIQNQAEPCVFYKLSKENGLELLLALFVDDILTTGCQDKIAEFRNEFKTRFRMSEKGGLCKHFLSIKFTDDDKNIYMDQQTYVKQKLNDYAKFLGDPRQGSSTPLVSNFQELLLQAATSTDIDSKFPYKELVGSLVYLANGTRFDITAAVSVVSRFSNNPKIIHCEMVKRIYHYLRANPKKLKFTKHGSIKLIGYCDASLGNLENYSSLAGFCFMMGNSIISWKSFKEPVVALSTAEAEYIALTSAVQECVFLQQFFNGLGMSITKTEIHEDNNACIALAKNPQEKKRTRHIQIRFHWIREQLENGVFTLVPTRTLDQLADIFTKGLHGPQIRNISQRLGLVDDTGKQGEN
jgi:hypothetical protein